MSASAARQADDQARRPPGSRPDRGAQTALEAKARFLTVMSHELRTPLNGVLTIAEILAMKMGETRLKPYVQTIQTPASSSCAWSMTFSTYRGEVLRTW